MAIFEDLLRTAKAHGASLVVAARSTREFRYLTESLRLRPIPDLIVVDLQGASDEEERRYRSPRDGHYNPKGHAKAARILSDLIVSQDLLGLSPSKNDSSSDAHIQQHPVT